MSIYNPPTLQQLAVENLLCNQTSTISTLEYLPINLFPPVFKKAITGRCMELLKAMVAAWPFSYLPVGALMKTANADVLQAVLDGVDILQAQKDRPREWKLRVLDLRNVNQDFWDVWASREDWFCSTETESEEQGGNKLRRDLKVVTDLSLRFHLTEHQTCLLQWAQQRKDSVQLCCMKMKICAFPVEIIKEILEIFPPEDIEELELFTNHILTFLAHIAPSLGYMTKLCKFRLTHIFLNTDRVLNMLADTEETCTLQVFSQFSKLNSLEHFSMHGIHLSPDHMQQLFGCLKTPLKFLSITLCQLPQSGFKHLSQCQALCQLKHLKLSGVVLSRFCVPHLRVVLENVADTLQNLELVNCVMEDSDLSALLPALSRCSQLTTVNFYDNDLSTAVLKKLVQSMAGLSNLTAEFYPASLECYDPLGRVLVEQFTQLCLELLDILFAKRQPKKIVFATGTCLQCCKRSVYDMETRLCDCGQ
ncbi:PRAME family member 12-like [Phodopus roborovskii]|uniref:PRAME family member 12-like n=1 Tax=Phodopus roborovskii TaxID=109678 RepID=UPI0021E35CC6|nr:PRAME family member 12-like [Phodopus roborovskii]